MRGIIYTIVFECVISLITYLQMFMVGSVFLEQKKKLMVHKLSIFFVVLAGIISVITLGYDYITYSLFVCIIIIFYLFKGKIIYKVFVVIMSLALNFIAEIITIYIMSDRIFELLSSATMDRLFIQLGSAMIVFMSIVVIKGTKLIHFQKYTNSLPKVETIALTMVTILSAFLVYMAVDIFNGKLIVADNIYFLTLVILGALALNLFIVILMDRNVHTRYYKAMNDIANKQLEDQVKYYEVIEQNQRQVRSIKHDMKNHLACIDMLVESECIEELKNYTKTLHTKLNTNTALVQTDHIIIDAILNDKFNKARSKRIKVVDKLGDLRQVHLENVDICIILSNALDNAIEAAEKVVDTKEASIYIDLAVIKGYFRIYIKNSVCKKVSIKKNHFMLTTKEDRISHGYGVRNIKDVVDKYNGVLNLGSNDDFFCLEIIIQLEQ